MLAEFGTSSGGSNTGCLNWFGTGGFDSGCTAAASLFTARRALLITRIFLRDHLSTTNGASCKVAVWKNPTADDPDTDGTHGVLVVSDTSSFNGTATPSKWYAVWDPSMVTSEWTLATGDTLGLELEDSDCTSSGFQPFAELWGVPLE
jgi:hypothetical protein